MSSKFSQIGKGTVELAARERMENPHGLTFVQIGPRTAALAALGYLENPHRLIMGEIL